jgi:surface antigen
VGNIALVNALVPLRPNPQPPGPTPPPPTPPPSSAPPPTPTSNLDIRGYSYGWCTWWCANQCSWIPAGLGNADTWGRRGWGFGIASVGLPTVGSVVQYDPGNGYSALGHVAVVTKVFSPTSFEVSEMAYIAWNRVDYRTSNLQDVYGFMLPPGVPAGSGLPVGPPPPAPGLPGTVNAWTTFGDYLNTVLPGDLAALALVRGQLGGL